MFFRVEEGTNVIFQRVSPTYIVDSLAIFLVVCTWLEIVGL